MVCGRMSNPTIGAEELPPSMGHPGGCDGKGASVVRHN